MRGEGVRAVNVRAHGCVHCCERTFLVALYRAKPSAFPPNRTVHARAHAQTIKVRLTQPPEARLRVTSFVNLGSGMPLASSSSP